MNIGILQDEHDTRDYLADIAKLVSARFAQAKSSNPRGYMDQADASGELWVTDAAIELGGVQVSPPNGSDQVLAFSFTPSGNT